MTIVDNFGPLNATSASRALQPAALGSMSLGGRRDFMQVEGCVCVYACARGGGVLCVALSGLLGLFISLGE